MRVIFTEAVPLSSLSNCFDYELSVIILRERIVCYDGNDSKNVKIFI